MAKTTIQRGLEKLVEAAATGGKGSTAGAGGRSIAVAGSDIFYGLSVEGGVQLEGADGGTFLPNPIESLGDFDLGDRVALTLWGQRPVILGRAGGFSGSDAYWALQQADENTQDEVYAQSQIVESHDQRLGETEQLVADTKDTLDAWGPRLDQMDDDLSELPGIRDRADEAWDEARDALEASNLAQAFAEGLLTIGEEPPDHEDGRVWLATDEDGNLTGIYQSVGDAWATYTVITGVLIVPGEDGMATVIDQNGMVIGSIAAESITGETIAAETIGARHLILADIGSEYLDGAVNDDLDAAREWAQLTLLEPGKITISQSPIGAHNKLTALILQPTKLDFIVDDESRAYIDSERNLMSIENAYIRDTLQVGQHQVKTLPGTQITVFNWTGE